jgi:hypothetical protein
MRSPSLQIKIGSGGLDRYLCLRFDDHATIASASHWRKEKTIEKIIIERGIFAALRRSRAIRPCELIGENRRLNRLPTDVRNPSATGGLSIRC